MCLVVIVEMGLLNWVGFNLFLIGYFCEFEEVELVGYNYNVYMNLNNVYFSFYVLNVNKF